MLPHFVHPGTEIAGKMQPQLLAEWGLAAQRFLVDLVHEQVAKRQKVLRITGCASTHMRRLLRTLPSTMWNGAQPRRINDASRGLPLFGEIVATGGSPRACGPM